MVPDSLRPAETNPEKFWNKRREACDRAGVLHESRVIAGCKQPVVIQRLRDRLPS
jgi:hypothetical protein